MKRSFLFLAPTMIAGLLLYACQPAAGEAATNSAAADKASQSTTVVPAVKDIDVQQFRQKMKEDDVVILDVRTPAETQMGKIDGAIEINISEAGFEEKINALDKRKTYLVYCMAGSRSSQACSIMAKSGFEHLFNLEGGYRDWTKDQ